MRTVRLIIRVIRVLAMVYGFWTAFMKSRWFVTGMALWGFLRSRGPARNVKRTADFRAVFAGDPAIYRRRGWRRLTSR